jgi:medium-chain acyl-[acyl-carrier-protein] hydrolase
MTLDKLLPFRTPRPHARARLICFPFAGGAASVFRQWSKLLPDDIDVCAVELPGRGARFGEPLLQDPQSLLEAFLPLADLGDLPTVYFGHSLGARIAFARIHGGARADALIVSGARPAHLVQPQSRSTLSKDALVRELRRLGGTPPAILDDSEMLDVLLPIVRADFRILETLTARADDKITIPMTVIAAADDAEIGIDEIKQWEAHAGAKYRFVTVDGGHFFLTTRVEAVLAEVRRTLDEILGGG